MTGDITLHFSEALYSPAKTSPSPAIVLFIRHNFNLWIFSSLLKIKKYIELEKEHISQPVR